MTKVPVDDEVLESLMEALGACQTMLDAHDTARMAEDLADMPAASPLARRVDNEIQRLAQILHPEDYGPWPGPEDQ